jgi:hypothetical protein
MSMISYTLGLIFFLPQEDFDTYKKERNIGKSYAVCHLLVLAQGAAASGGRT